MSMSYSLLIHKTRKWGHKFFKFIFKSYIGSTMKSLINKVKRYSFYEKNLVIISNLSRKNVYGVIFND
ncbi:hypothetical protein [Deltalipothrixvirus pozzuoliense]|uniref:Uncharacterized protein ORF67b n=1 Tax=Acidianus filamentous virus 2 (isolate Italy/Pozzuoli) TaxID=654910 RepID=Y067B_AFV2P|nr:hypothetical protein AFV2_gp17 [Acidianus filamentous virus 2]Q573F2.1 RecName: Full=Uncharacterized protein ORF67b [Acidianus filamentous virus 2 (isolate Pozzuoli)]CAH69404.1 hypothetical protein [Acidianus filamentous virus 2]